MGKKKGLPVEEDDWKPMLGRLINDSKCDVLITKFGAKIPKLFSLLHVYIKLSNKVYICMKLKSLDKPIKFEVLKYLKMKLCKN